MDLTNRIDRSSLPQYDLDQESLEDLTIESQVSPEPRAPNPSLDLPPTHPSITAQASVPVPPSQILQFRLLRTLGTKETTIELLIEDSGRPQLIMVAKRIPTLLPSYRIYTVVESSGSPTLELVGGVSSYSLGTAFRVFESTKESDSPIEIATVSYKSNILGRNGPRKITVYIPGMTNELTRIPIATTLESLEVLKSSGNENIIQLQNKIPQWNEETQSFVLNFNGRVAAASVKNFQIVHERDLELITLQFGRVSENVFSMDVRYPFSILQAFGIVLTSFVTKFACE